MSWKNERKDRGWKVGDKYWIYSNGKKIEGEIVEQNKDVGFMVKWSDGETTWEAPPVPSQDWSRV